MNSFMIFSGSDRFPSSHAGTICELPNGDLLAAWYSGKREGSPDSVILGSRLNLGENRWQEPKILVNVVNHAAGNPRLFLGPDNAIWLIAPVNYGHWCNGGTRLFLKRSFDHGITWSDLEIFPAKRRVLGKNKPIHLKNSSIWIFPMDYEGIGKITFMRSEDNCRHFQIIDLPNNPFYLDQPTVVELNNHELLAYARSWEGYIYETHSMDTGMTWSFPTATSLLNPNSGIDMTYTDKEKLILVYNPVALGPNGNLVVDHHGKFNNLEKKKTMEKLKKASDHELNRVIDQKNPEQIEYIDSYPSWGPRYPLVVSVSSDNGKSWSIQKVLEEQPGEFSYPAIITSSDKRIHILYTYNRTGIKYCSFDPEEL